MKINDKEVMSICPDDEDDGVYFSYEGCENCNNGLGDDVRDVQLFVAGKDGTISLKDWFDVRLCHTCLCAYYNAEELPDDCQNVFEI